jgi:lipopolysaccharide export system protein LptA
MYKLLYILKNPGKYLLLTAALLIHSPAWSLSTDKDQPIEIEANAAELDDQKGITIYTGNVVVTQGSIRMTGDKMTVYYTRENDLDTVIMVGQPATYRQLPDNREIYDEAEALRMEFYNFKNLIVLIDNALVKQEDKRFSGNRIEYDTLNSKVWARGASGKTAAGEGDTPATDSGRVKIIIHPKKKE